MGLSIHYNARFNKEADLAELIAEVRDIAEILKWDYFIFSEEFPPGETDNQSHDGDLYGIDFTPPGCESVSLCFLSNRRMSDIVHLKLYGESDDEEERKYLYMLATKTQFADVSVHKAIIHLFRHLVDKNYFEEFNLIDEGEYWETGDEKLLESKHETLGTLIDNFSLAVQSVPSLQGESYINYFERIVKLVQDTKKKDGKY